MLYATDITACILGVHLTELPQLHSLLRLPLQPTLNPVILVP